MKAFVEDKVYINVTQKLEFVLGGVKNIVRNGIYAGYQHNICWLPAFSPFLLFPQHFKKLYFSMLFETPYFVVNS